MNGHAATISALVCVRNGAAYLEEALASIASQTLRPTELIVIDDGSSDGSADLARAAAPHATVESHPPRGLGYARQRAMTLACGEILAFLDADDIWHASYLERHLDVLSAQPSYDATMATVRPFLTPEKHVNVSETSRSLITRRGMLIGSITLRRSAVLRVGPFRADLALPDQDFLMRAREAGLVFADASEAMVHRRIHGNNITLTARADMATRLRQLKQGLDRRRQRVNEGADDAASEERSGDDGATSAS